MIGSVVEPLAAVVAGMSIDTGPTGAVDGHRAECIVGRSEQSRSRNWSKAGPEYLSLLGGVYPEHFTIIEPNDGTSEVIEGTKTFDYYNGSLPYVPNFDVVVTVKYQLWKNGPPPKNKPR